MSYLVTQGWCRWLLAVADAGVGLTKVLLYLTLSRFNSFGRAWTSTGRTGRFSETRGHWLISTLFGGGPHAGAHRLLAVALESAPCPIVPCPDTTYVLGCVQAAGRERLNVVDRGVLAVMDALVIQSSCGESRGHAARSFCRGELAVVEWGVLIASPSVPPTPVSFTLNSSALGMAGLAERGQVCCKQWPAGCPRVCVVRLSCRRTAVSTVGVPG